MNIGTELLFGKGKVSIAERDSNGTISEVLYVGNCPTLKISSSSETLKHFESQTGTNAQDREITTQISMEVEIELENIADDVAAVLLWGTKNTLASAPTQSHFFPSGIADGEYHIVPNGFKLTVPVLKDSAGSPATVDTADYEIDASFGVIKFNDVSGYTQPFELEYTRGAGIGIPLLVTTRPQRFIRFEGINLGNPGLSYADRFLVELYNVGIDPAQDISLIGTEFAKFPLKGSVSADDTRSDDATLGAYGRIIKFTA